MQGQYKVELLPTAWEDLTKIEDYYLLQFGVESAMKVTEQILDSSEQLSLIHILFIPISAPRA